MITGFAERDAAPFEAIGFAAADIVALDGEIIAVLAERERRRKRDAQEAARQSVQDVVA
jgi:hypothetical protein